MIWAPTTSLTFLSSQFSYLALATLGSLLMLEHTENALASKHVKPLSLQQGVLFEKTSAMAMVLLSSDLC